MPSIYLEAADAVEREAARAESLAKVAADLRRVGSLTQAADEAQARIADLARKEASAKESIAAIDLKAAAILRNAQHDGQAIIEAANTERDKVIADCGERVANAQIEVAAAQDSIKLASEKATSILSEARNQADAIIAEAKARAEGYAPAIAKGEAALAEMGEQVIEAQTRLDDINKQIAALRAKF